MTRSKRRDLFQYLDLLHWLHEYVCQTFDRASIGHYVDLFQILYHEVGNSLQETGFLHSPCLVCEHSFGLGATRSTLAVVQSLLLRL